MKLSAWVKLSGLSYRTAYRLFSEGKLPLRSEQLATGTILVYPEVKLPQHVAIYGRVSSSDQRPDLERQMERLRNFCAGRGWTIAQEVQEIGSGLNGHRRRLAALLRDPQFNVIVVEHRDRLARFGVEMVADALAACGRKLVVINQDEHKNDLVQDFTDVVTSMCARIYGQRSAKRRAKYAVAAAST